jgi:hypothetical protein
MARNVRNQLAGELSRAGIAVANTSTTSTSTGSSSNSTSSSSRNSKLQRALCAGFFMNGAQQCSHYGVYRAVSMPGLEVRKTLKHGIYRTPVVYANAVAFIVVVQLLLLLEHHTSVW